MPVFQNEAEYGQRAAENFRRGANCAQAVLLAFQNELNMDEDMLMRLGSSFGGGMGRMREVCGAVSGMLMIQGLLSGYTFNEGSKSRHYKEVRGLADDFKAEHGSIICRELLTIRGADAETGGEPSLRTSEFYSSRNCPAYCASAARLIARHLSCKE